MGFFTKRVQEATMSESFDALGVTFDFSRASLGEIIVKNKESRLKQISEELAKAQESNILSSATASALRGRLYSLLNPTHMAELCLPM